MCRPRHAQRIDGGENAGGIRQQQKYDGGLQKSDHLFPHVSLHVAASAIRRIVTAHGGPKFRSCFASTPANGAA
jgi:hypothetical protein